jgi:hypothetical protein
MRTIFFPFSVRAAGVTILELIPRMPELRPLKQALKMLKLGLWCTVFNAAD